MKALLSTFFFALLLFACSNMQAQPYYYNPNIQTFITNYGCTNCHGAASPSSGYNQTTYLGVLNGGSQCPPAVRPFAETASPYVIKIDCSLPLTCGSGNMPATAPCTVSAADIAIVRAWIRSGALGDNTFCQSFTGAPLNVTFTGFTGTGFNNPAAAGQLDAKIWNFSGFSDIYKPGNANTTANTDYTRGATTGGVTTGGIYALNYSGGTNQALWIQPTGTDFGGTAGGTVNLQVCNNTGSAITALNLSYDILVLNDQGRSNSFNFFYSTNGNTYTQVAALDYTSTAAADAAPAVATVPRSTTLTGLSIPNGAMFFLRWFGQDVAGSGSRDEFGLDNISLSVPATCSITGVSATTPTCSGTSAVFSVSFTVSGGSGVYNVINTANNSILASGSSSPISVTIANSAGSSINVNVVDAGNASCTGTAVPVTLPNCSPVCSITGVAATAATCSGANATFNVSFTATAGSGVYNVINTANNSILASGTSSPIAVTINNATGGTVSVNVVDAGNASCAGTPVTVTLPNCTPADLCEDYTGSPLTINFTGFNGTGFTNVPGVGQLSSGIWNFTGFSDAYNFGGVNTTGDYARGATNGGITSGGIYALNYNAGANQALWIQPTGTDFNANGTVTLAVCNFTGSTLNSVNVAYDILVLNDAGRASSFNFSYSTNGTTFTPVPALNYTTTETADAAPALATVPRTTVLSGLALPNNGTLYLRWTGNDVSGAGSRDEIGLDNIVLSPPCSVSNVAATTPVCSGNNATFSVSFTAANGSGNYNVINTADNSILASGTTSPIAVTVVNSLGSSINVNVVDAANSGCAGTAVPVTLPTCVATCVISNLTATAACDGIGQYDLTISFNVTNPTGFAYNILVGSTPYNGNLYAGGSAQSIVLQNLPEGSNNAVTVQVTDASNPGCTASTSYLAPNCTPVCGFSNLNVTTTCTGDDVYGLTLTFNVANPVGTGYTVNLNGTNYPATYAAGAAQTFTAAGLPDGTGATTGNITITDNASGTCTANTTYTIPNCTPGTCPNLVFSGYVEGSGFNKCVEIYNGTGAAVDLSNYSINIYFNGASTAANIITLSGTLAAGDYYLVCHTDADFANALAGLTPDVTTTTVTFNGDDAVALNFSGTNVDVIGTIGTDPGNEWAGSVCTGGTQDQTLVKKFIGGPCAYGTFAGTTNFSAAVDGLYDCYPNNNVTNLYSYVQPASTVSFLLPAASVDENAGTYSLCVDINNPDALNATTVQVALTGGDALNSTDIATYATQTVTFPAGSSANQCVTITIVDDTDPETNETLVFTLQNPSGGNSAAIGAIATTTITITDDDSGPQPCPDLVFSAYVEGSSFNKCVEIYNGTGANVDLVDYSVQLYNNGNTVPNSTIPLSGILANGDYFLLCHVDALLDGLVPDLSSASLNYNGDDAVALLNEVTGLHTDVIGTIGTDPGTEWAGSVCTGGTQDQTLVKKNLGTLCPYDTFDGVTNFSASVDLLYDCYPNNTSNVLNTWQSITCNISNISISTTCTSQLLYDLTVTFTVVDPVSTTYVVTVNGNDFIRTYTGSSTQTFTIFDLPEGNGLTTNTVTITDAGYGLCSELASYVVPDCTLPCSIDNLFGSATCSGNGVYDLSISFAVTSPAGSGYVVNVNGTDYNSLYVAGAAQSYTIPGLTGSPGVGSIAVTDATDAACTSSVAYDIPDCIIECSVLNGTQNVNSTSVCSGQPIEYFAGGVTDNDYTGGFVTWVYGASAGFDAYAGGTVFAGVLPANNGCSATVWYLKARLDGVPGCTDVSGEYMVSVYPNIFLTVTQSGGCTAAVAASCSATITWTNPATGAIQSNAGNASYTAPNCTAGSVTFTANLPGSPAACQGSVAVAYNCNQGGCGTTGCTDAIALNYNPFATVDDGSCQYAACTDPAAVNYTPPAANIVSNNSLCVYAQCPLDFTITNNSQGTGIIPTFFDVFTITLAGSAPYSFDWTISGYVTYTANGNVITVVVADGATWSLQVADAFGCEAVISEDAYNNNPAATTLDIVSNVITADNGGGTGAIDISVGGGVTPYGYLWSNGATTQDISGLHYGWYTVTVTDAAGNQTFGWYWVPKQTRGRGKTVQQPALEAFPNPFGSQTTVVFSSPESGNATVSVYNIAGTEVARLFNGFTEANTPQTLTFNAAHLPAGVYVVQLITQSGTVQHSRIVLSR